MVLHLSSYWWRIQKSCSALATLDIYSENRYVWHDYALPHQESNFTCIASAESDFAFIEEHAL
jgi:hypothetical protein